MLRTCLAFVVGKVLVVGEHRRRRRSRSIAWRQGFKRQLSEERLHPFHSATPVALRIGACARIRASNRSDSSGVGFHMAAGARMQVRSPFVLVSRNLRSQPKAPRSGPSASLQSSSSLPQVCASPPTPSCDRGALRCVAAVPASSELAHVRCVVHPPIVSPPGTQAKETHKMAGPADTALLVIGIMLIVPQFTLIHPYLHLLIMAPLLVYTGCMRALADHQKGDASQAETVSKKDAMQFPLVGSAVLFGLYVVIKFVKKEYLDLLISIYFTVAGAFSIYSCTAPALTEALGMGGLKRFEYTFHWKFWKARGAEDADPIELSFSMFDLALFVPCAGGAVAYAVTKKWWLNNLLGCAFSVQGIEMLALGSYAIGCILLAGLFLYDIFWVFGTEVGLAAWPHTSGLPAAASPPRCLVASFAAAAQPSLLCTLCCSALPRCLAFRCCAISVWKIPLLHGARVLLDRPGWRAGRSSSAHALRSRCTHSCPRRRRLQVMVSVAKGLNAPVKILFPKKLGVTPIPCSMLGLGDIVIPGIFIALLLRFDASRGKASQPYFISNLIAYEVGLAITVGVMHFFDAAQPALLYLVPACIGASLLTAAVRGEFASLVNFSVEKEKEAAAKED